MPTSVRPPNYHLFYPLRSDTRVCFYVSKELNPERWAVHEHSPDLITLTLQLESGPLHIHNCYNEPPKLATSRELGVLRLLPQALQAIGQHVLVGDFNLHHPMWSGVAMPTQHALADDLIDIALQADLELVLPPGSITWRLRQSMSTLDLAFATSSTAARVSQCRPCDELDSDSDHVPVLTSIMTQIPERPEEPARPQWRKADWPRVREVLGGKIAALCLGPSACTTDLDEKATKIQEAIQDTVKATIPVARRPRLIRVGWSEECTSSVRLTRHARRQWTWSGAEGDYVTYRAAANGKQRQIRKDTILAWRETVEHVSRDPKKMWKLARWARTGASEPPPLPQFPPMQEREDVQHDSNEAKADILASHFFPPPRDTDLDDIEGHLYPAELDVPQMVTADEVTQVLKQAAPDKAPGPDGIPNRMLRECSDVLALPLATLFQECLQMSHHPSPFRHSNTVVLRKPQKSSYNVPKAYRPIALLNTLGKALEKIVAQRLSKLAEAHKLLPDTQMGARPGRSTITALELLTEQIRTVWAKGDKLVASLLSLDISGAFDNVSHERLIHNLRDTGVPGWIAAYIRSFLSDRTTFLTLGTYQDRTRSVATGIPQGSTLSPILFLFFASTLLPRLNDGVTSAIGFVDDTNILTFSRSTEANCRTLERAHETCVDWARTHGATFAPEKYQLIHFTPKLKKFNMKATVRIPGYDGGPSPVVRMLGVHLDSRLKWGPHVRLTATKAAAQMSAVTRLTQSTWGASFARARQIYAAVVRPAMSYAAEVWYNPDDARIGRNKLVYSLQIIQNKCLRTVTGAYKTTSVPVVEHEAGVMPLDLHLESLAINHALRSKGLAGNRVIDDACEKAEKKATERFRVWLKRPPRKTETLRGRTQGLPGGAKRIARAKAEQDWATRWRAYQAKTREDRSALTTAQDSEWDRHQWHIHKDLPKAESTMATLLRTEHIGMNDYLHRRKVPGYDSPICECGWPKQTVKHILLFCPRFARDRDKMIQEAGCSDFSKILSTPRGIRAAARWFLRQDILTQFSLTRDAERTRRMKRGRRAGEDVDDG